MKRAKPILVAVLFVAGCSAAPQSTAPGPGAELLETYWRPVEIAGKALAIYPGTREPHIMLRAEGERVTGFTGCNSLTGGIQRAAGTLRFDKLAMTRMACVSEAGNALEAAFTKALNDTASYRITGNTLELQDAAGSVRMKLEGRAAR